MNLRLKAHGRARTLWPRPPPRLISLAPTRLSFVHAVDLIHVALADFHLATPAQHDRLYQRLLRDPSACRLSERGLRTNPQVVKRKMSKLLLKCGSPPPASQHLVAFEATIHILPQDAPDPHALDRAPLGEHTDDALVVPSYPI